MSRAPRSACPRRRRRVSHRRHRMQHVRGDHHRGVVWVLDRGDVESLERGVVPYSARGPPFGINGRCSPRTQVNRSDPAGGGFSRGRPPGTCDAAWGSQPDGEIRIGGPRRLLNEPVSLGSWYDCSPPTVRAGDQVSPRPPDRGPGDVRVPEFARTPDRASEDGGIGRVERRAEDRAEPVLRGGSGSGWSGVAC